MSKVLVTGGAGFIGGHLVDALLADGHAVRALDALEPQVHPSRPSYLAPRAEYEFHDLRNVAALDRTLEDVDVVFHLAARVGVAQSMYRIRDFVEANSLGTAELLERIARRKTPLRRLVVASSNTIYGEGRATCPTCGPVDPPLRSEAQLERHDWELHCPRCSSPLRSVPTPETKAPSPTSVYAITKRDEEDLCRTVGQAYGIPTVVLRFFAVYGPRQALSNPYTGVCAIFLARLRHGQPPILYEDGAQTRDFVNVHDVVAALRLAAEKRSAVGEVLNVGTGVPTSIREMAERLGRLTGRPLPPKVTGEFRAGDIRHCIADISRARSLLGYEPSVKMDDGLSELLAWSEGERPVDASDRAYAELAERGLLRSAPAPRGPTP